jgi:hypothetical protein
MSSARTGLRSIPALLARMGTIVSVRLRKQGSSRKIGIPIVALFAAVAILACNGVSVAGDPSMGKIVFKNRCRVITRVRVSSGDESGPTVFEALVPPRGKATAIVPRLQSYAASIDWNADYGPNENGDDTGRQFTLNRKSTCKLVYDMGNPRGNEFWIDR